MPFIFIIFIAIYLLLSFYVAYNGWVWLHKSFRFPYKKIYFVTMLFFSISFIISRFIHIQLISWMGYLWLIMFGYGLLVLPIMNLIYFSLRKRGLIWYGLGFIMFFSVVIAYGSYNVCNPVVVSYNVEIDKQSDLAELKILLVSDIHISETIGVKYMKQLIALVNEVKPDVIFLAGDVIDNSIEPYLTYNLSEIMSELTAPLGVYAVLGNHEYYGGDIPIFLKEMNEINIEVLTDEVVNVNDLFYIVGRKDFIDKERASIGDLTRDLNKEMPILVVDHQPREYDEAVAAGVDLLMSGHTHKGQVFPGNLITNAIYENHYGYYLKDTLHTIVSSGYGIWGPPFRIGSRSEVVEVNVRFGG